MKKPLLILLQIFTIAAVISFNHVQAQKKGYAVGDAGPAGGIIFYVKTKPSGGWRYLEASPADIGIVSWGCRNKKIPGAAAAALGSGRINTTAIINSCGNTDSAAKLCVNYKNGKFKDWYLPSKDELNTMYKNLKAAGAGGLSSGDYWSSTSDGPDNAWGRDFDLGYRSSARYETLNVRAIRSF